MYFAALSWPCFIWQMMREASPISPQIILTRLQALVLYIFRFQRQASTNLSLFLAYCGHRMLLHPVHDRTKTVSGSFFSPCARLMVAASDYCHYYYHVHIVRRGLPFLRYFPMRLFPKHHHFHTSVEQRSMCERKSWHGDELYICCFDNNFRLGLCLDANICSQGIHHADRKKIGRWGTNALCIDVCIATSCES